RVSAGALTAGDLEALRRWTFPYQESDALKLAVMGEREMFIVGRRYGLRLQELFNNSSVWDFKVTSTNTDRAEGSAWAFLRGCFGPANEPKFHLQRGVEDSKIWWPRNCPRYQTEINSNPATLRERSKFQFHPAFRRTRKRVSIRLGLSRLLTLRHLPIVLPERCFNSEKKKGTEVGYCFVTSDAILQPREWRDVQRKAELTAMYDMCRFEVAHQPFNFDNRPWCAAFTKEDLLRMRSWDHWAKGTIEQKHRRKRPTMAEPVSEAS
ncbi:unnamed protein product, partial [Cyprideis torosa]